ncbi:PrsW family intramembrane metalloprotease [Thermoleophilia bacterium SCSIO 60948]|nr:PrsW family intramembrane metalloprotease [Thermoleophilia bacterium SCSIO 60948]
MLERRWDGDVWLDETRPAAAGVTLAKARRHPTRFLRDHGWLLVLAFIALSGVAGYLWRLAPDREHVEGAQLALPVCAVLVTLITSVGLLRLIDHRVGFAQVGDRGAILAWGTVAGLVGVGFAFAVELGLPNLLGSDPKNPEWDWIAGPAEETGKLIVPVALWFAGRFRLPRQGLLLVLFSGITFALIESGEYALSPEGWSPTRPPAEIMHPLFTGLVAAFAWRAAWGRRSWFTPTALAAWAAAMAIHSINDGIAADDLSFTGSSLATPAAMLIAYLLLKHGARQLVPPDRVEAASPRWRPVAPRRAQASPGYRELARSG